MRGEERLTRVAGRWAPRGRAGGGLAIDASALAERYLAAILRHAVVVAGTAEAVQRAAGPEARSRAGKAVAARAVLGDARGTSRGRRLGGSRRRSGRLACRGGGRIVAARRIRGDRASTWPCPVPILSRVPEAFPYRDRSVAVREKRGQYVVGQVVYCLVVDVVLDLKEAVLAWVRLLDRLIPYILARLDLSRVIVQVALGV